MINTFEFYMPTKIIFGKGKITSAVKEIKKLGKRPLFVTDQPLIDTGLLDSVFKKLREEKIDYVMWTDIVPNPRDRDIERGGRLLLRTRGLIV